MNEDILHGLRILDFSRVLAGPYASRLFADFGAEVIKIQSKKTATGAESNYSGYFKTWNRNKRSITLDLNYPEAREIALKLTAISDVVVENFSPRVMSNWGLDYANLRAVKPDLVMISMSGMGHTGPWRNFVAFGPTIQALSGMTFLSSVNKLSPTGLGFSYADVVSALFAVFAVLIALHYRDTEGMGQHIDLSEYEALCTLLGPALLEELSKHSVLPQGNRANHIQAAPYGSYRCLGEDRWCVIAAFNETQWHALCKVLGNPTWTNETRFSTLSARIEHASELDKLLENWTTKHKAGGIVQVLQEAGVPAGVVQNAEDLEKDPQLAARDFFVRLEHPVYGDVLSDNSPIKMMSSITTEHWKASPLLGEDNRFIFTELLEMEEAELLSYIRRGIVS